MSENSAAAAPAHHTNYVKIWAILVALLVVSVAGPFLASATMTGTMKLVFTLLTAFGIAFVKAYLVLKNFMHIGLERRFVTYLLVAMLAIMLVMVGGVAPDVMKHDGLRWSNIAAHEATERGLKEGVSEHGAGFHEAGEGGGHEAAPHHE